MVAILKKTLIETEQEDFFLMANLGQKTTGLPMIIWVSERGDAKHSARIKVSINHTEKMNISESVSVSVSLTEPPEIMAGDGLSQKDFQLVTEFIRLNRTVLLDYWNNEIDTADLIAGLKKLNS